jgi:hypothetical protein
VDPEVFAIRYAIRVSTKGENFLNFHVYGEPDGESTPREPLSALGIHPGPRSSAPSAPSGRCDADQLL